MNKNQSTRSNAYAYGAFHSIYATAAWNHNNASRRSCSVRSITRTVVITVTCFSKRKHHPPVDWCRSNHAPSGVCLTRTASNYRRRRSSRATRVKRRCQGVSEVSVPIYIDHIARRMVLKRSSRTTA